MFSPTYQITGKVAKALMSLEADRQLVATLPLSARMLDSLRRTARLLSTHLSTQIEGNRLTAKQVEAVVEGEGNFPGRERDEAEVRHYFAAMEYVERISGDSSKLIEKEVRTIHSLVMSGKSRASRYRDGQNVIRDSRTNRIVYMPPEPKDVPAMMRELVQWINNSINEGEIPVPVVAALAHYQFATIHPYFDGNGRTARLLTNLILHRNGYGLNGIYSLEEYYADNLSDYYGSLAIGSSHNYYFGRAEADVTPFVTYFCLGMAEAFAAVRSRAEIASRRSVPEQTAALRDLSVQQRRVLGLFLRMKEVARNDLAKFFKLPSRQAYLLCQRWLKAGFLVIGNPATKTRTYRLAEQYEILLVEQQQEAGAVRKRP